MDDNGGPKNGGTDPIISNTSTGSNPFKTTTQPDVPAWMFSRNNSVHAPVFGQPSDRQSASHKQHSMPSSFSEAADSQSPFAKIRASIATNNAKSQAKASQPSPQPLSCAPVTQETLSDYQALALLLKNKTVAGLFQKAVVTRVEEHHQKLEQSYNQRLLELEEYTRSWRDNTKELWSAVSEGTFNPTKDHQETLSWEGPQLAGRDFNPDRPTAPQEIVEKEFDKDGTVVCINVKNPSIGVKNPSITVKNPSTSHVDPHFNLLNWRSNSKGCGSKDFETFAQHVASLLKKSSERLVYRHETKLGTIKYRAMKSVDNTIHKVNKADVVIDLTPSNVALFGKAFCYLKDTHDRLFKQADAHCAKSVSAAELSFLFDRFSPEQPTKRLLDVLPLYDGDFRVIPDLFARKINVSTVPKRLLIARPCYAIDGSTSGAKFFDVARGAYTTRQESDEDVILFEDKVVFIRLALLLCFSINTGIVPFSLGASTAVLSSTSLDAGFKPTGLRSDQVSRHPSASIVPNLTHGGPSQEGVTDIKGSANDFTSMSFLSPGNGVAPQNPHNGESEQSDEDSTTMRGLFSTDKTQQNPGLEPKKRTPVASSLPPAQPSLFQRTLDLSKGLKELEDDARRDGFRPQARSQWLAIGGEPQDIRSPSPKRQQERIANIPSQAYCVEEEVLPSGPDHPGIEGSLSKDTEESDLVVLDERPMNVTFRCGRKRPFPAADEKVQTAKRPKILKAEPSTVSDRQLPQSYPRDRPPGAPKTPLGSVVPPDRPDKEHLGQPAAGPAVSQAGTEGMGPLATSNSKQWLRSETMARRTKELKDLQEQLRQLGCRIEADFDQANRSTIGGNIETSGQLQVDGAPGRTPASSEVTASQQLRENLRRIGCRFQEDIDKTNEGKAGGEVVKIEQLQKSVELSEPMIENQRQIADAQADLRPAAPLPSLGVPDQNNASSGDSNSLFTVQERFTDAQKILTDQSESTPVEVGGEEVFKWSDSPAHEAAKLGRRARRLRRG